MEVIIKLSKLYKRINQLLSLKVDNTNGYKAISQDGYSTSSLTSNQRDEIKFNMDGINELPESAVISPHVEGFHYCEFLSEVLYHRPLEGKYNRKANENCLFSYYKIDTDGQCYKERKGSVIVTNRLYFKQKIENKDMLLILLEERDMFYEYIKSNIKRKKHYKKMIEIIEKTISIINN